MSALAPAPLPIRIPALDLQPGDVIVAPEEIGLLVTHVRNTVPGWTVFEYLVSFGAGARTLASGQQVKVIRTESEAH